MLFAHDDQTQPDSHPFWYAHIHGIFHTWVIHSGPRSSNSNLHKMEFLWIFGLGCEPYYHSGWRPLCLDCVGFISTQEDRPSFGFIDPSNVVCAAYLIPTFAYGQTLKFLGPSIIHDHSEEEQDEDWNSFHMNRWAFQTPSFHLTYHFGACRFVDCDMFMRYLSGGIGHATQTSSSIHWQISECVDDKEGAEDCVLTSNGVEDEQLYDSDEELDVSSDEASELDDALI